MGRNVLGLKVGLTSSSLKARYRGRLPPSNKEYACAISLMAFIECLQANKWEPRMCHRQESAHAACEKKNQV